MVCQERVSLLGGICCLRGLLAAQNLPILKIELFWSKIPCCGCLPRHNIYPATIRDLSYYCNVGFLRQLHSPSTRLGVQRGVVASQLSGRLWWSHIWGRINCTHTLNREGCLYVVALTGELVLVTHDVIMGSTSLFIWSQVTRRRKNPTASPRDVS